MTTTPVPTTVLTGFLGSGKTTLLNWLLQRPHGLRIAVIINEFGAVGIDGAVAAGGEQFVELDNGCLCCALNADLDRTLRDLQARGGFDHLIVETTGLADPLPVAWAFSRPGLSHYYRLDAIVTVVDAASLDRALAESGEARLQIERADLLVLNKLDLVNDEGAAVEAQLRAINDFAPLLPVRFGEVPWDLILGSEATRRGEDAADTAHGHTHAEHTHASAFETWAFETEAIISDRRLEDFLYAVPSEVYRFKGLLRTDAGWDWTLVNAVAGRFDVRPIEPTRPPASGRLVFIGRELDRGRLQELCLGLVAAP